MDEKTLWQKFCENGKVVDYLTYRSCVNSVNQTELKPIDENNCTGSCDKRTEYR